jgi:hypothetical protein
MSAGSSVASSGMLLAEPALEFHRVVEVAGGPLDVLDHHHAEPGRGGGGLFEQVGHPAGTGSR